MHLTMALAGDFCALPTDAQPWCRRRYGRRQLSRLPLGLGLLAQAGAVGSRDSIDGIGEVVQQVPTIGYLDRVRRSQAGAFGLASGAVSTDDLGPRMGM